jgi:RNA recognition motif-containing protein
MAKKLFVGNLPYTVGDEQLREMFANAGLTSIQSANVVTDKFTGKSRGFGFVELSDDAEAEKAISSVNGQEIDGRAVVVNEARPMQERKPGGFGGGRPGGFRGGRGDSGGRSGGYGRQY